MNYLLFSDEFKKICYLSSAGVTNRRYLDETIFLNQKIPFPDIKKQIEITKNIANKKKFILDYTNKINKITTEIGETISNLWKY